ncbi:hypothetical protein [Roseobacter sp.]|uniref:hypothetical protein n=1 Tax=Roseobacter sp. TaxID=1907202 RepID=UPI003297EE8B
MNMILRQVMRRVVNKGIDAGMKKMAFRGDKGQGAPVPEQDARQVKQAAKTLRRTTRL